jgi:hypothetical protein
MGPEGDLQRYTTTKDRWDLLFSFDDNLSPSTVNFSFDLKQELLLCKCQIHQKEEDNRDKGYQLPPKLLCHGDLVMCFGGIFYNLCYDLNLKEMTLLSEAVTRVHNGFKFGHFVSRLYDLKALSVDTHCSFSLAEDDHSLSGYSLYIPILVILILSQNEQI